MNRAVTLLECLIVIAIVTVLSAILMAVIGQGRQSALRSADLEKMHQLGIAFNLYHDTEGGFMRSPRDLRTVASLPNEEFVSTGDQVPGGIGNALCRNGGNPMPSIYCTDFPRTFVSYGDLGQHIQSWTDKALSQSAAGWLMSPMDIGQKEKDPAYWSGSYHRLTVEGSVIVRHHEPRRGIGKNGLPYENMVPMTLLCDPDAATLEKWFQPLPGEG